MKVKKYKRVRVVAVAAENEKPNARKDGEPSSPNDDNGVSNCRYDAAMVDGAQKQEVNGVVLETATGDNLAKAGLEDDDDCENSAENQAKHCSSSDSVVREIEEGRRKQDGSEPLHPEENLAVAETHLSFPESPRATSSVNEEGKLGEKSADSEDLLTAVDSENVSGSALPGTAIFDAAELEKELKALDEEDKDDDEEENEAESEEALLLASPEEEKGGNQTENGTLWFKLLRVLSFFQLLSLLLQVGSGWPSGFSSTYLFLSASLTFVRTPAVNTMTWASDSAGIVLASGQKLSFYGDILGHVVDICLPAVTLVFLFFFLVMPDYTSSRYRAQWESRYLHHWLSKCFAPQLVRLLIACVVLTFVVLYGSMWFPKEVVQAATVVGGLLVLLTWLAAVVLSFSVHRALVASTAAGGDHSFIIMVKHIVHLKVRMCLFLLLLSYVPATVAVLRGMFLLTNWDDTFAVQDSRDSNYHVHCYFAAFPPQVDVLDDGKIITTPIMDCASLSGIVSFIICASLFFLYVIGIPRMCIYLADVLLLAFEGNGDVVKGFSQAQEDHHDADTALWRGKFGTRDVWREARHRRVTAIRQSANGALQTARRKLRLPSGHKRLHSSEEVDDEMDDLAQTGKSRMRVSRALRDAFDAERETFAKARGEYIASLKNFESDHILEIVAWESVVDTSGFLPLVENFTWMHPHWSAVVLAEQAAFISLSTMLHQRVSTELQLTGCVAILLIAAAAAFAADPFLYLQEARLDATLRSTLVLIAILGCLADAGYLSEKAANALLHTVMVLLLITLMWLADAVRMLAGFVHAVYGKLDEAVARVLFGALRHHTTALEGGHGGLSLLSQWDDLLTEQRWGGFMVTPSVAPRGLLCWKDRAFSVRWAALRGLDIESIRLTTSMSLLHDSMANGEAEAARWLIKRYPGLLQSCTRDGISPLLMSLLQAAEVIMVLDSGGESAWRAARFMDLFLSPEVQTAPPSWNAHQYEMLTEHGETLLAALAQHLAECFNLHPPQGYVSPHTWAQYDPPARDFLAEALCASHSSLDMDRSSLGDRGLPTLEAVASALARRFANRSRTTLFTSAPPLIVRHLNLRQNRLGSEAAHYLASILSSNATIEVLLLGCNDLDAAAAGLILDALASRGKGEGVLTELDLSKNRIGPDAAESIAAMLTRSKKLRKLDLSGNFMGEKRVWYVGQDGREMEQLLTGAGPSLGMALSSCRSLKSLNLAGNKMGAGTGPAFGGALRNNSMLTHLDLSDNAIGPEGGRALTLAFTSGSKCAVTHLSLGHNFLGPAVGKLLAVALKKNRALRWLDISDNSMRTRAVVSIAISLRTNLSLTHLNIARNMAGPSAASALGATLELNEGLTSLNISGNRMGIESPEGGQVAGVGMDLGRGLRRNGTLTSLRAGGNNFPKDELHHFTSGLADSVVQSLCLEQQYFDPASAVSVSQVLRLGRLRDMQIAAAGMAGPAALTCAKALVTGAQTLSCRLVRLNLAGNDLSGQAASQFAFLVACPGLVLQELELSNCRLGDVAGTALGEALGSNRSLTALGLSSNSLGPATAVALSRSLRVLYAGGRAVRPCLIARLDLSRNPAIEAGGRALVNRLVNDVTSLLNLEDTGLAPICGKGVGKMLRSRKGALDDISLNNNNLGREGVNEIFWALRRNSTVTTLQLARNGIGPVFGTEADVLEGHGTSIRSALAMNESLTMLNLRDNGLSAECCIAISEALADNFSLSHLILDNNLLDDSAAENIAEKLTGDRQLRTLSLAGNQIGWRGGLALARALASNRGLSVLELGNNSLGEAGEQMNIGCLMAEALTCNAALSSLGLQANRLGPAAGVALADALLHNSTLMRLDLRNNRFDQEAGKAFESSLRAGAAIGKLEVSEEEVGIDAAQAIHELLEGPSTEGQ
jgi:Ran GTPase-activating protein (RanGAP) involved in mRNA processing and transport